VAARPAVRRTLVRRSMRIMAQSLKRPSVRELSGGCLRGEAMITK
jgi:hypothetical protein